MCDILNHTKFFLKKTINKYGDVFSLLMNFGTA